jgi:hypothetical protein
MPMRRERTAGGLDRDAGSPDYPDEMIAPLVTDTPTPYVLRGHTLAEVQAQLPPGLERTERQPSYPPDVVEIWFPG